MFTISVETRTVRKFSLGDGQRRASAAEWSAELRAKVNAHRLEARQ